MVHWWVWSTGGCDPLVGVERVSVRCVYRHMCQHRRSLIAVLGGEHYGDANGN